MCVWFLVRSPKSNYQPQLFPNSLPAMRIFPVHPPSLPPSTRPSNLKLGFLAVSLLAGVAGRDWNRWKENAAEGSRSWSSALRYIREYGGSRTHHFDGIEVADDTCGESWWLVAVAVVREGDFERFVG